MNKILRLAWSVLLLAMLASGAWADAVSRLKEHLDGTRTLRGRFTQSVTDRNGRKLQETQGSLLFARPGLFRWIYEKPYEQIIVGDGKRVWFYDPDLEQVTVQPMDKALGGSPAALLAGSNAIEKHFKLSDAGRDNEGIEWLNAIPKQGEGTFERLKIGFRGKTIVAMELKDNLGQTSRLRFSQLITNAALPSDLFHFKPPKGVDVIGGQ